MSTGAASRPGRADLRAPRRLRLSGWPLATGMPAATTSSTRASAAAAAIIVVACVHVGGGMVVCKTVHGEDRHLGQTVRRAAAAVSCKRLPRGLQVPARRKGFRLDACPPAPPPAPPLPAWSGPAVLVLLQPRRSCPVRHPRAHHNPGCTALRCPSGHAPAHTACSGARKLWWKAGWLWLLCSWRGVCHLVGPAPDLSPVLHRLGSGLALPPAWADAAAVHVHWHTGGYVQ